MIIVIKFVSKSSIGGKADGTTSICDYTEL